MAVLRVWGRRSVANVQKVMWCLGELGIEYVHEDCNGTLTGARDNEYVAQKGAGVVPLIDDDGFVLWEGNAVARYLARKHGRNGLWPEDPQAQADAERWMDYQLSTARVHLHPLMRETPDAREAAFHARMLAEVMKVPERALEARDYLAGDAFTVADIPLGIVAYRWEVLDIPRPPMPAIEAWLGRLRARPAFRAHVIPPEGALTPLRAG